MESGKRPLSIIYSPSALAELEDIWVWNAERYGREQADKYVQFLFESIEKLSSMPLLGSPLSKRRDVRWLLMKWKAKGYGHVAVYVVDEESSVVTIAHIFHTSQQWRRAVKTLTE